MPVEDATNVALRGVGRRDKDRLAESNDQNDDRESEPHQTKNQAGALGLDSFLHTSILARGMAGRCDYYHNDVRYSAFSSVSNKSKQTVVKTTSYTTSSRIQRSGSFSPVKMPVVA